MASARAQKHLCCRNVAQQKPSCFPFSAQISVLKRSPYYKTVANLHLLHSYGLHRNVNLLIIITVETETTKLEIALSFIFVFTYGSTSMSD